MPRYDYECDNGHQQEMVHGMREAPTITCHICQALMRRIFMADSNFYTPKDKAYEFTTTHVQPGTRISTKGQWQRFLKRNGMTDDIKPREAAEMVRSNKANRLSAQRRAETVKKAATHMMDVGHKTGLNDKL